MAEERLFGYLCEEGSTGCGERRRQALLAYGVAENCLYCDSDALGRSEYFRLMKEVGQGDVLVLAEIGDLGINRDFVLKEWNSIREEKKAHIVVCIISDMYLENIFRIINPRQISPADWKAYQKAMAERNISLDSNMILETTFAETDILLSDFSSAINVFFLTGRPVIYCGPLGYELSPDSERIFHEGLYEADTWEEVEKYLAMLLSGEDPLLEARLAIIEDLKKEHLGATDRIVNLLLDDYRASWLSV